MIVLGVHTGHDSGAALVVDGRIVADVSDERFTRIKHGAGLPFASVQAVLDIGAITIDDVDAVAIPSSEPMPGLNHLFDLRGDRQERSGGLRGRALALGRNSNRVSGFLGEATTKMPRYAKRFPLPAKAELVHVDHHRAHAASAYYTSGNTEKQLVVTIDGVGDDASTVIWRGEDGRLTELERHGTEGSLGWFYGNVTEALGWAHGDGEGKTMGLAPYGKPGVLTGQLDRFTPRFSGGALSEPHDFGTAYVWLQRGSYEWHFDEADEIAALVERYGAEDVALEAQTVLEREVAELVFAWMEREGTRNLTAAGGVMLNVKLNQRLWESDRIDRQHVYPNPADSGVAVGAALQVFHDANPSAPILGLEHLYRGPSFAQDEIDRLLRERHLAFTRPEDVVGDAAQLLADNRIVGWFQGAMEAGPRALGGRSILMNPTLAENKDLINAKVKFREAFRPFCPSLPAERQADYLVKPRDERWMITSFSITDAKRDAVPAVTHVDGTLRPQTVDREINPRYWELLTRFGELSGEAMLLNTSFNVMGEPIVCNPREALRAFFDTGLDYLVLGRGRPRRPAWACAGCR